MDREQRIDHLKTKILDLLSDNSKYRASEMWQHFNRQSLTQDAINELFNQGLIAREKCEITIQRKENLIEYTTYLYFVSHAKKDQ